MGSEKIDNKHGVGIMLNKRWRQRSIDTEYINQRAISTTIMVNRQRIKLMSVYFSQSGYADHHIEKCTKTIEKTHCKLQKIHSTNWWRLHCRTGDLITEMNVIVLADTHSTRESNEVTG